MACAREVSSLFSGFSAGVKLAGRNTWISAGEMLMLLLIKYLLFFLEEIPANLLAVKLVYRYLSLLAAKLLFLLVEVLVLLLNEVLFLC